jgi:hypothetical protein
LLLAGDLADSLPAAEALQHRAARTARPAWQFDTALGERKLCEQLKVASLQGFNAHRTCRRPTPPPPRC